MRSLAVVCALGMLSICVPAEGVGQEVQPETQVNATAAQSVTRDTTYSGFTLFTGASYSSTSNFDKGRTLPAVTAIWTIPFLSSRKLLIQGALKAELIGALQSKIHVSCVSFKLPNDTVPGGRPLPASVCKPAVVFPESVVVFRERDDSLTYQTANVWSGSTALEVLHKVGPARVGLTGAIGFTSNPNPTRDGDLPMYYLIGPTIAQYHNGRLIFRASALWGNSRDFEEDQAKDRSRRRPTILRDHMRWHWQVLLSPMESFYLRGRAQLGRGPDLAEVAFFATPDVGALMRSLTGGKGPKEPALKPEPGEDAVLPTPEP
jgi:hypothetical protein